MVGVSGGEDGEVGTVAVGIRRVVSKEGVCGRMVVGVMGNGKYSHPRIESSLIFFIDSNWL